MISGGKWKSSTVRAEDAFAPAIAVVEIEERAGDDDSELLLISSSAIFPQYSPGKIFRPTKTEREKGNNVLGTISKFE